MTSHDLQTLAVGVAIAWAALGAYAWHLHRRLADLERRLEALTEEPPGEL